jgi:hypothetical protein
MKINRASHTTQVDILIAQGKTLSTIICIILTPHKNNLIIAWVCGSVNIKHTTEFERKNYVTAQRKKYFFYFSAKSAIL